MESNENTNVERKPGPLDGYDPKIVQLVLDKYWKDFAILPYNALEIIKKQVEEEIRNTPSQKLASILHYEPEQNIYENFINNVDNYFICCMRFLVLIPVLWHVLRKRDIKDDSEIFRMIWPIANMIFLPFMCSLLNIDILFCVAIITFVIIKGVNYIVKKINPDKINFLSLKIFLGLLPFLLLTQLLYSGDEQSKMIYNYAPYLDGIIALLQTVPEFRIKNIHYYFIMQIIYRIKRLLIWAFVYYMHEKYNQYYIIFDIVALYIYIKVFKSLKNKTDEDLVKDQTTTISGDEAENKDDESHLDDKKQNNEEKQSSDSEQNNDEKQSSDSELELSSENEKQDISKKKLN